MASPWCTVPGGLDPSGKCISNLLIPLSVCVFGTVAMGNNGGNQKGRPKVANLVYKLIQCIKPKDECV